MTEAEQSNDFDDLKLEAKDLGVKSWHLFKDKEKLQEAIDEKLAEESKPEELAVESHAEPDNNVAIETPKEGEGRVLVVREYNGASHSIWVQVKDLPQYEYEGYEHRVEMQGIMDGDDLPRTIAVPPKNVAFWKQKGFVKV